MTEQKSFEERIPEALATTGFLVEHEVAQAFRAAKWGVIGSRYYIDDVDGRARELDLIVYKVVAGPEVDVVTSVLISCKKDNENAWVVMSRDRPTQDPNLDWDPVHQWTNNKLLKAYLESVEWSSNYVRGDKALYTQLFEMKRQAFAFQLVSKKSCKSNNDKPIFGSLTDLMKAQDHELSILPERIKENRLYVFNLMAVVDAPIYEARYDGAQPVVVKVDEFRHLARYIVRRRDTVSRVNICNKNSLQSLVQVYDRLAKYNKDYFNSKITEGYSSLATNRAIQLVLAEVITKKLRFEFYFALVRHGKKGETPNIGVSYDNQSKDLLLEVALPDDDVEWVASDQKLLLKTREVLEKFARYSGAFRYTADIPF